MENLSFIINHVRLVNLALDSIGALNGDIENEDIIDATTKSNYIKQMTSAKNFEYSFNLYSIKLNQPKSISVYDSLKQNLNEQTSNLLIAINKKSLNNQRESIQIDLVNLKAILEISQYSTCINDSVCSTIRKFTGKLLEDLNETPNVDFKDFIELVTLLDKVKKIVLFEVLIEDMDDCEFRLQMDIIFETSKLNMQKKLLFNDSNFIDEYKRNNAGFNTVSYPNIKFIIKHVSLVNQCKDAMDWLRQKIENNEPIENDIDIYFQALKSAHNLEYSFFRYSRQFTVKSVSMLKELMSYLAEKTSELLKSAKPIDLDIVKSISEIAKPFENTLIDSIINKHVKNLATDFRASVLNSNNTHEVFEKLKSLLVLENLFEIVVNGGSDDELFDNSRQEFYHDLEKTFNKNISLPEFNCSDSCYESYYESMEKLLQVQLNYKKFAELIKTDPVGVSLNIPASTKLDELHSSLNNCASQLRSRFDTAFEFLDKSARCQETTSTFEAAKQISYCLTELQFVTSLPNCSNVFANNLYKKLEGLVAAKKISLEHEMNILLNCDLLKKLSDKLVVCKALATYFPDIFAELHEKYLSLSKEAKKQVYERCSQNVLDFEILKESLELLNENDEVDGFWLEKLKKKLNSRIEAELKQAARIEGFEEIFTGVKALEMVINGREILGENFFDSDNCTQLEDKVKCVVKDIVAMQIEDGGEGLVKVSEILSRLSRVGSISEESKQMLAEMKSGKKDFVEVDRFLEYDLETCFDKAPSVVEKIKKNADAVNQLERIVCLKLKQRLDEIKTNAECLNEVSIINKRVELLDENLKVKCDKLVQGCTKRLLQDLEVKFIEAEILFFKFLKQPSYSGFDLKGSLQCMREVGAAMPERFGNRLTSAEEKMNKLIADMNENFEKSLNGMDVPGLKKQLEFIEFVSGDYERMEKDILERVDLWAEELMNVELLNAENGRSMAAFEKVFEAISQKLQAVCAVERVLQEKFLGVRDFKDIVDACLRSLGNQVQKQFREGCERLSQVIDGDNDTEIVKEFIANYYNLVMFERKMPQLQEVGFKYPQRLLDMILKKIEELTRLVNIQDITQSAEAFIAIKSLSVKFFVFKDKIDKLLDKSLNQFIKQAGGFSTIGKLGVIFKSDPIGSMIMAEHKIFESFQRSLFNRKTLSQGIEYVLADLEGDLVDKKSLKVAYDKFKETFDRVVMDFLKPNIDFDLLISKLRKVVSSVEQPLAWGDDLKHSLPLVIGYLFGLWTLLNATNYFDLQSDSEQFNFIPHPAQVVAIFRMLGLGYTTKKTGLARNLVQVGTGEGKSVTLAITAVTLALFGMETFCVCYSDYLSNRDYKAFEILFSELKLLDKINYGTFNKICEDVLNRNGNVRSRVENFILKNELDAVVETNKVNMASHRVLLIDEVDVFFSKDFYGNKYNPSLNLMEESLSSMLRMIWNERGSDLTVYQIKETKEFRACVDRLGPDWEPLILEAVKDMLYELRTFETGHDYVVQNDMIGYKEQDNTVFDTSYGYKTLFAYFKEHDNGNVSDEALAANISILIRLGTFSYAEVPKGFQSILGCSGTLNTLSKSEKNIIENVYRISLSTFIPSVYGRNNLRFNKKDNILIESDETYYQVLKKEIEQRLVGQNVGTQRAVFVVFENRTELEKFLDSTEYQPLRHETLVLNEELNIAEKNFVISTSTSSGKITFFTKIFGRGTDFKVHDRIVSVNGGVHVIQTFLSEELSEEVQIKGRTARQSEDGSFSMVISIKSLEKFQIKEADVEAHVETGLYEYLNWMRCEFFNKKYDENIEHVATIEKRHVESIRFLEDIACGKAQAVRDFLIKQNKAMGVASLKSSKTLILIDATASMSHLLDKTKNRLETMFERVYEILRSQNLDINTFQIKIGVYRNYNSDETMILQTSSWENKAQNLIDFLRQIYASGGWGNEAIEIGLWQANQEQNLSQVILIGDAPANTAEMVYQKRARFANIWENSSRFPQPTYYENELFILSQKNISVHAFFVHPLAENDFRFIAEKTGGKSEWLDIDSNDASEKLTNLVNIEVLRNIGGNDLVECYKSKFNAF